MSNPYSCSQLTICITAYNEESNVPALIEDLDRVRDAHPEVRVVIRDNCSQDATYSQCCEFANSRKWIKVVQGALNIGYGGGMRAACLAAETEYVAIFPADRQYPSESLKRAIDTWLESAGKLVIGRRTRRQDGYLPRVQSYIYSTFVSFLYRLQRIDVNGLPKVFPRALVEQADFNYSKTFFFDAQLIDLARRHGVDIEECEVKFLKRREGVSSWSNKRLTTSVRIAIEVLKFRMIGK